MICRCRVRTPWAKLLLFVLAQLAPVHLDVLKNIDVVVMVVICRELSESLRHVFRLLA